MVDKLVTIDQDKDSFTVSVRSTLLLQHTRISPLIYVGKGNTTFVEREGNFDVKDDVTERIPLRHYVITETQEGFKMTFSDREGTQMVVTLSSTPDHQVVLRFGALPEACDRIWLRVHAQKEEYVWGGGQQYTSLNLRGRNYPIWTREQGVGRDKSLPVTFLVDSLGNGAGGDYHTTYYPQGTFMSSRHYYCHVGSTNYMDLDFSHENYHEIMILGQPETVNFQTENSYADLLTKLTSHLGRQPMLPEWVHEGTILGVQGGTEKVLGYVDQSERCGLAVSGLWIQDWSGRISTFFGERVFWNWEWDPKHYPDLDVEIRRLYKKGIRLFSYITPHLNTEGSVYQKNKGKGYFVKDRNGADYTMDFGQFDVVSLDFTNPKAWDWYKNDVIKKNLIDFGFSGWMADFGEYQPVDAVYYNGEDPLKMHNRYPVLWAQLNREAVEESGKLGEILYWMRSGGAGMGRYSVINWSGDQNVDWSYSDGLASTIPAALSLGMSGFGLNHFDIGGYTTISMAQSAWPVKMELNMVRSEELFTRGAELAIFSSLLRTHEGNRPKENYQVYHSDAGMKRFSSLVEIYRAMTSYRKHVMRENTARGIPVARAMFVHYEADPECYKQEHQFMFGSEVLVAPVVDEGEREVQAYLPAGSWIQFFTGAEFSGPGAVTVDAPLGRPTAFYRSDAPHKELFKKISAMKVEPVVEEKAKY